MRKTIFLFLALCLSGCGVSGAPLRIEAYGGARWPMLPVPEKLTFNEDEKAYLDGVAKDQPGLSMKLAGQMKAMRVTLVNYNKKAWSHNAESLRAQQFSEEEIARLLGPDPNKQDQGDSGHAGTDKP